MSGYEWGNSKTEYVGLVFQWEKMLHQPATYVKNNPKSRLVLAWRWNHWWWMGKFCCIFKTRNLKTEINGKDCSTLVCNCNVWIEWDDEMKSMMGFIVDVWSFVMTHRPLNEPNSCHHAQIVHDYYTICDFFILTHKCFGIFCFKYCNSQKPYSLFWKYYIIMLVRAYYRTCAKWYMS